MSTNPKILNLDEVELPESDIAIRHKGTDHKMRTVTVGGFVEQQKRAATVEQTEQADENGGDIVSLVVTIRNQVSEFFPTLPVDELETAKLFAIFRWLNEITAQINAQAAPEADADGASAEGNEETPKGEPVETPESQPQS